MPNKETQTTEGAKLYELGFHIIPTVTEEKVPAAYSLVKDSIIKIKGNIIKEGEAKHLKLAYTIVKKIDSKNQRFNDAYFAWIKFIAESADIEDLKKSLDGNTDILRYIIVKTVEDYEHSTNKLADEMAAASNDDSKSEEETETESDSSENEESSEEKVEDEAEEADKSDEDNFDQVIDEIVEEK